MNRLQQTYQQTVAPQLKDEFKLDNDFQIPGIKKIVVNMGIKDPQEPRQRKQVCENVATQFEVITGQKPQITYAKKSIAGFKLREGDPLGVMVTLRGEYMWEFLDKLISISLPRVKDFRGVKKSFDGQGNFNLGIEEQIIFPEIDYDQIENVRGLQVTMVTSSTEEDQVARMLELLGMPFEKEDNKR